MNQNVSNNGSWMKLMSADAKTEKLSKKENGVSVAFSSFLSSQLTKSNNMMNTDVTNIQKDTAGAIENARTLLKKVEPTANKLAVKSPERVITKETKNSNQEFETKEPISVGNTADKVAMPNEITSKGTETTGVEQVQTKMTEDVEKTISMEEVAALLQQLMTYLVSQVNETPDASQMEPLQDQIQLLSNLLNQVNQLKDLKIDGETFNRTKSAIDQILLDVSNGEKIKPEMFETIKQVLKELKSNKESSTQNDFNKVLESKHSETAQIQQQSAQATSSESSVNSNTTAKLTEQAPQNGTDKKAVVESNVVKSPTAGNEKVEVKVQTTENKTAAPIVNADFNAKLESASIAFSKVEVANQVTKVPLQHSIMDQLINSPRMQVKQTEQGTMMTMKLNPEVLGDVEIKMEIVKGVLQAEIKVESMIVKGAIEAGLSDLKNALSDKGYQVESLNVSVGKDGQFQQSQQQQQHNERHGHLEMDEHEIEKGTYGFETVINDNQIDYRG